MTDKLFPVILHSSGHDPEQLYLVPKDLYEEIKAFDNKWGVWSDSYRSEDPRPDSVLIEKMEPYKMKALSCCTYA